MKIVAVDPILLFPEHIEALKKLGKLTVQTTLPKDDKEIVNRIKDAEVVIDFWTTLPAEVIRSLVATKMICSAASGADWIDIKAATAKGIVVTHCPGHNGESVAEHTIGLMLAAMRHTFRAATETRAGKYEPEGYKGKEIKGKILGIIGYGSVGKRVAEIAEKGFGVKVLYTNSKSSRADLEELLRESDIVSVNAPLNDQTLNLLGEKEFKLMKDGVVFVNTGRGAIVDESALLSALKSGKVYSAGLDILAKEPFEKNNPLLSLPNVIVTPHIAWNTPETDYRLSAQVVEIVKAFVAGKPIYVVADQRSG